MVNEQAVEWAKEESGKLIKEITETTLDMVRGHVEKALTDGLSTSDLADLLTDSEAFSDSRADMIARTELAFANVEGTREAYKESGVVSGITWQVSEDDTCDECMEKSDKEGTLEDGVDGEFPPLHPNCRCDIMPILDTESEKMAKAMVKVTQDLMQTIRALAPQPPAPINISFPPINLTVEKADASKTIQFTYDDKGRVIGGTTEA